MRNPVIATAALMHVLVPSSCWAGVSIIDLGPAGDRYSLATSINNNGQVTGTAYWQTANTQAFLWDAGQYTNLGTIGGSSNGSGINASGQIVGYGGSSSGLPAASIWQNGVISELQGSGGYSLLTANDINDAGQITGQALHGSSTEGYLLQDEIVTGLGTLGGNWSDSSAINNSGQIVGESETDDGGTAPFIWQNGVMSSLDGFKGAYGRAYDINDSGSVVGDSIQAGIARRFLWQDGTMQYIGPDNVSSYPQAINNHNDVVGAVIEPGNFYRGFLWHDGSLIYLDDLLADSNWQVALPIDINDNGQIVGTGIFNGQHHAFLMTVPGPGSWLCLGLAAVVLIRGRRQRNGATSDAVTGTAPTR